MAATRLQLERNVFLLEVRVDHFGTSEVAPAPVSAARARLTPRPRRFPQPAPAVSGAACRNGRGRQCGLPEPARIPNLAGAASTRQGISL